MTSEIKGGQSGDTDAPLERDAGDASTTAATTVQVESRARVFVRRFRLSVVRGPDAGLTFAAVTPRAAVGTHQSADLVLSDRTVSRFHCEVTIEGGRVTVRDLDSRNGTLVNGVNVIQANLDPGALITVGETQIRYDPGSDSVEVALSERSRFGVLVGGSVAMRTAFATLERAAPTDATILLHGETGTGKEAAAESIHRESGRRDGPFIVVDCGAIPADLLESELFGHERGAFTGAVAGREGAFEAAKGGTLFLDEIGELSADLQPKLLRVLERREVKRIGSNRYHVIDARIVAATHRNLRAEVNAGRFRSDLYYRLAVVEVALPPLRKCPEDLPLLVDSLLDGLAARGRPEAETLRTPQFISELARHNWPGNVRELRNYLERCLALREQAPIVADVAEPAPDSIKPDSINLHGSLKGERERWNRVFERRYVEGVLALHDGNVSAAARAAGVDRMWFYRILRRHGIR
jgi:two-component system response regulator GlrR